MGNRSMLEFNHDFTLYDDDRAAEFLNAMRSYLASGNPELLPAGVTWFGIRHHSTDCPMGEPPRGWNNEKPHND